MDFIREYLIHSEILDAFLTDKFIHLLIWLLSVRKQPVSWINHLNLSLWGHPELELLTVNYFIDYLFVLFHFQMRQLWPRKLRDLFKAPALSLTPIQFSGGRTQIQPQESCFSLSSPTSIILTGNLNPRGQCVQYPSYQPFDPHLLRWSYPSPAPATHYYISHWCIIIAHSQIPSGFSLSVFHSLTSTSYSSIEFPLVSQLYQCIRWGGAIRWPDCTSLPFIPFFPPHLV